MKRRDFGKFVGATMVSSPFFRDESSKGNVMEHKIDVHKILDNLIRVNDEQLPGQLKQQKKDKNHQWHGGIVGAYGLYSAITAAGFIKRLACAYVSPPSNYHYSNTLATSMSDAVNYLVQCQYDDGTIDLPTTNFHSTPDTAFVVEPLCIVYALLLREEKPEVMELLGNLKNYLLNAGKALSVGGIHTANHRWVICMALARLNTLFPNEKYLNRLEQWLGENIDIDEDGQYSERSTYIYTPLVNRCLITIAKFCNKPDLYTPVRKNLELSLYFRHANGEVVTESSRRQDKYQRGTMKYYYYPYRTMAIQDGNHLFAAMAQELERTIPGKLGCWLGTMLEDKSWLKDLPEPAELPDNYLKDIRGSNIIRIRRGLVDASVLLSNPTFFTFFNNQAALEAVRLATAFFGKGQFQATSMKRVGNTIVLSQKLTGPYYQPMDKEDLPDDGDWNKMPKSKRLHSEIQYLESTVNISEDKGKFELEFIIDGTDNVPAAIELAFRKGGNLTGVTEVDEIKGAYLSKNTEKIRYEYAGDVIEVAPGSREHSWSQLRGALPKLDAMSVYLTGYTPFRRTLKIG